MVLRSVMAVLVISLALALFLFWPVIRSASSVERLEDGLYSMEYSGDYGLEAFIDQGGGSSDMAVAGFVIDRLFHGVVNLDLQGSPFGCSTLSIPGPDCAQLFGRNFDWGACATLIVQTYPRSGYASISTVKMIEDRPGFDQYTEKPDLTTTTAVRLLLDKAASVDEALDLLRQYDLHASAGMMVHFAIADTSGRSVAVEYVNNEMSVVETPIVTNFYLTPGEKHGIGTEESHRRYEILAEALADHPSMTAEKVRDAMDSVSKHNFDSVFASTEWSIVFDQTSGEARYYHRENFENAYVFRFGQQVALCWKAI